MDEGYLADWLVAIVLIIITSFVPNKAISTANRFITPKDPAHLYPFVTSTVSNAQLMVITFLVPFAVFTCFFAAYRNVIDWHHACLSLVEGFSITFTFKRWMNIVGRYRPDWFARMREGMSAKDGRMAYPSGHAAYSMFAMTLVTCYLIGKFQLFSHSSKGCFAKALLAVAPVAFATWVAVTRAANYKHDFSDINAGCFIGLASGIFAYFLNFNSFFSPASAEPKQAPRQGWATGFVPPPAPTPTSLPHQMYSLHAEGFSTPPAAATQVLVAGGLETDCAVGSGGDLRTRLSSAAH